MSVSAAAPSPPLSPHQLIILKNNNEARDCPKAVINSDAFSTRRLVNSNKKIPSIWEEIANRKANLNGNIELSAGEESMSFQSSNPFLTNKVNMSNCCISECGTLYDMPSNTLHAKTSAYREQLLVNGSRPSITGSEESAQPNWSEQLNRISDAISSSPLSLMLVMTANTAPAARTTITYSENHVKSSRKQKFDQTNGNTSRPAISAASVKSPKELSIYIPSTTVQRRSHSTPRPLKANISPVSSSSTSSSYGSEAQYANTMSQRPRSLDRATTNSIALGASSRPPPIPSTRRFSQPLSATTKNGVNSAQYPAATFSQQRFSASGMRQSVTFHGQLDRHTTNASISDSGNSDSGTHARRRKADRPLSFAYGSIPDQSLLENQLRVYSEQLRTITESVRKYSEQAKVLSEMKRQQQQLQQRNLVLDLKSPQKRSNVKKSLMKSDSNIYMGKPSLSEQQTSSLQLRQLLDNIRDTMKQAEIDSPTEEQLPRENREDNSLASELPSKTVEAKTPSDQLRLFLDAIRTNQLPEEEQSNIANAADRFSQFNEKMEHARSKSTPNFEQYITSPNINQTFTKVSDNLRIMSEDLATLSDSPKNAKIDKSMDFNQILDSFSHLTNNSHPSDSAKYLRKCSEALRYTSNQLRIATTNNSHIDASDNSSCSTTPGCIREAVQNLLQQPRKGVQIMDDRMKLFIDILDTQSKFNQVTKITIQALKTRIFLKI